MMKNFHEILERVKGIPAKRIAVAVAQDASVLEAVNEARKLKIADALLVGDKTKILEIAEKSKIDVTKFEVIHETDNRKAALTAVKLVSSHKADMVMKGLVDTATLFKAVLQKDVGLRTDRLISHVGIFEIDGMDRLLYLTDAAFNTYPDLKTKLGIIHNAVNAANAIGTEYPKVAAIGAVEVVNPDMQATMDAAVLAKMNDRGQIKRCIIDGPLAFDNAVSEEAAAHKGIRSPVAGRADILLMPNIETGNALYKSLIYMAKARNAGILMGAAAPVIVTSRADSMETKVHSIALAALVADLKKETQEAPKWDIKS